MLGTSSTMMSYAVANTPFISGTCTRNTDLSCASIRMSYIFPIPVSTTRSMPCKTGAETAGNGPRDPVVSVALLVEQTHTSYIAGEEPRWIHSSLGRTFGNSSMRLIKRLCSWLKDWRKKRTGSSKSIMHSLLLQMVIYKYFLEYDVFY